MIDVLLKYADGKMDVVSKGEVKVNDEVVMGYTNDRKPILHVIKEVHEQRKERGVYRDETNRRMWAKIS